MSMYVFFTNQTANANSAAQGLHAATGYVDARGVFDTASLDAELLTSAGTWISVPGFTPITAPGIGAITLPFSGQYRLVLSSVGASTDVTAAIRT